MKCFYLFCLFVWTATSLQAQQTKRIFFIGNSYTFYNDLPGLVDSIANNQGNDVVSGSSTPGGAQLVQHVSNSTTLNGIRQGNWDFVVIQEQSQKPSFPDAQVATDVYPYAEQLNDTIEQYNPCGETAFFMTWGRKNGDQQNCQFFAPLCTYEGMQNRLRKAYLQMATDNAAICSPVGAVWSVVRDSFPAIELYTADESHPSYAGSYLTACTFYAALFREPVSSVTYYGSLADSTAQRIQRMVDLVVLDSLSNWFIGDYDVQADFASQVNSDTVQLTNMSQHATTYAWDFGDGTPLDTLANPTHVYAAAGNYTVTLVASDSCGRGDTVMQSITVSTITGHQLLEDASSEINIFPNPTKGVFTIDSEEAIEELRIVDALGREIFSQKNMKSGKNVLSLDYNQKKGIYFIYINTKRCKCFVNKLVLQ